MPTQKVFKQRVRARMQKTGEAYTTAREQLLRKAARDPDAVDGQAPELGPDSGVVASGGEPEAAPTLTSDEAMIRGSGRSHAEWFALLDAWDGTARRHPELARWLRETHAVPGWWAQNITVAYERARGIRRVGQMADGFQVAVTRTVGADAERTLAAFVEAAERAAWLPQPMTQRPTRAALTARFDWPDPASRVVVALTRRPDGRTVVSITHEKLPDADAAERYRTAWRHWLDALRAHIAAN